MGIVIVACFALVIATSVLHYEALGGIQTALPGLRIPGRAKLLVVILMAFVIHTAEIALYGVTLYGLIRFTGSGSLTGTAAPGLVTSIYFSAETYTSLGFGDLTPAGSVRLLAGVEALNGLLMIGWSASFTYLSMERFWREGGARP